MNDEKIPELEVEQSEVEPIELPEGRRRAETGDQQDFGKDPTTGQDAPTSEEEEKPENESGKFPRAEKRRKHREEQAELKKQRAQQHKMMQEMQKPVRHRDLFQIYQQINQFMLAPQVKRLQDQVDKLSLIPDFLSEKLGRDDIDMVAFEEYYEKWLEEKKAEEAELAKKEQETREAAEKAAAKLKGEEENTPETEETQTE